MVIFKMASVKQGLSGSPEQHSNFGSNSGISKSFVSFEVFRRKIKAIVKMQKNWQPRKCIQVGVLE